MEKLQIGPVEIRHQQFSSSMLGYKKDEVHEFLEIVASQMEDLLFPQNRPAIEPEVAPKKTISQKIEKKEKKIVEHVDELVLPENIEKPKKIIPKIEETTKSSDEALISQTLILAEKMRSTIISEAEQKAKKILKDAEETAQDLVEDAKNSLANLVQEYFEIKDLKKNYLMNIRSDLQVILDRIDQKSLLKNDIEKKLDDKFNFLSKEITTSNNEELENENDK